MRLRTNVCARVRVGCPLYINGGAQSWPSQRGLSATPRMDRGDRPGRAQVKILYSREGYYIAFGPEYEHATWRTVGVDQFTPPTLFGVTYIKTIDTRNPFLDEIAECSKRPRRSWCSVLTSRALALKPEHRTPPKFSQSRIARTYLCTICRFTKRTRRCLSSPACVKGLPSQRKSSWCNPAINLRSG